MAVLPKTARHTSNAPEEPWPHTRTNPPNELVFFVLRMMNIASVEVHFDGGFDSGSVASPRWFFKGSESGVAHECSIDTLSGCSDTIQEEWLTLCNGGIGFADLGNATSDIEKIYALLVDAIEAPIWSEYGSFAGSFSASGHIEWDVEEATVNFTSDETNEEEMSEPYRSEASNLYERWRGLPEGDEKDNARKEYDEYIDDLEKFDDVYDRSDIARSTESFEKFGLLLEAFHQNLLRLERVRLLRTLIARQPVLHVLGITRITLEESLFNFSHT